MAENAGTPPAAGTPPTNNSVSGTLGKERAEPYRIREYIPDHKLPETHDSLRPTMGKHPIGEPVTYRSLYIVDSARRWAEEIREGKSPQAGSKGDGDREIDGPLDPFAADLDMNSDRASVGVLMVH